ncbi:MAG: hypothetical protein ACTSXD_06055 [Candidatus Heimdallarchaeaceae archaeon]
MFKVAIAPYSRKLSENQKNPKDYSYFPKLIRLLRENIKGCKIIQLGEEGEELFDIDIDLQGLPVKFLTNELLTFNLIISVDSFVPHLCAAIGKQCVVLFSVTDPKIFGHKLNINLIKDKKYIAENKFDRVEQIEYNPEAFLKPEYVCNIIVQGIKAAQEKAQEELKAEEETVVE